MGYALLVCENTTERGRRKMGTEENLTRMLADAASGDAAAVDRLYHLLSEELRRMAQGMLARERPGHTIQPTMLVDDVYVRLIARGEQSWDNRRHFFGAAAEAMRRILIDHARARGAAKRRPPGGRETLENVAERAANGELDVESLEASLDALKRDYPRPYEVVMLKFYSGRSVPEIADLLQKSARTIEYDWKFARAFLLDQLASPSGSDGAGD